MNSKSGFSMLEIVFVITIIGILSAIAIPRLAATRTDAKISKAKATVAAVRSGIVSERQTRMLQGNSAWITAANLGADFSGVLQYPDSSGMWAAAGGGDYTLTIDGKVTNFTYNEGTGMFTCTGGAYCTEIDK